jgi:hypothetical protein
LARCPNYIYFGTESPPCNRKLQFLPLLPNVQWYYKMLNLLVTIHNLQILSLWFHGASELHSF